MPDPPEPSRPPPRWTAPVLARRPPAALDMELAALEATLPPVRAATAAARATVPTRVPVSIPEETRG